MTVRGNGCPHEALIIEFVGTAGSGKTTLIQSVLVQLAVERLPAEHCSVKGLVRDVRGRRLSRTRRLVNTLAATVAQPRLTTWCLLNLFPGGARFPVRRVAWLCRSSHAVRQLARRPGIHLVDEGPMKVITPMIDRGARRPGAVLRLISPADLYVIVTVAPHTSLARVRSRGNRSASDEEILAWHRRHQNDEAIVGELAPVLVVDTTDRDPRMVVSERIVLLARSGRPTPLDP